MIKIVLFDIYGMIISRNVRFSQRFSKDLNLPIEKMSAFFEKDFQLCLTGKADLKEELKKHIKSWGWQGSVEELLQYWFEHDKEVNYELLNSVKSLRESGIKCFLNTQNEKYIVQYVLEDLGLEKHFDGVFSSNEIGFLKVEEEYWQELCNQLGKPNLKNVLCWDDEEKNIKVAERVGFLAELYTNFADYNNKIKKYLNN